MLGTNKIHHRRSCLYLNKKNMVNNIITGILNIVDNHNRTIGTSRNIHNSLHAMGEPLEDYIKDVFSSACGLNEEQKAICYQNAFSYGGGKNNPPDAILKNGDAIEVKKVESIGGIPLNSSYPKAKLYKDDSRISSYCRQIEDGSWDNKDMIYAIGCVQGRNLKSLALVYGSVYCADKEHYEKVFDTVKQSINSSGLVLEQTNELAHINAVDPLGITYFRARGMWGISHPFNVFKYIHEYDKTKDFELMAIIPTGKFNSFENRNELIEKATEIQNLVIEDKQVKNPNNTVEYIDVKLVTFVM